MAGSKVDSMAGSKVSASTTGGRGEKSVKSIKKSKVQDGKY